MNNKVYIDTISKGDNGLFTVGGSIIHEDGRGKPFAVDIDEDVMEYICEEAVLHLDATGYTDSIVETVMEAVELRLKEIKLKETPVPLLTQEQYKERIAMEGILPEDL